MVRSQRFVVVGIIALVIVVALAFTALRPTGADQTLALQAPSFVESEASTGAAAPPEVAAGLSEEAGISAYFKSPDSVDLADVRPLFVTIETETTDYIIGSMSVPEYGEHYDVHVYVHTEGWVLTYYPAGDPVSKIVDWKSYDGVSIETTKLRNVLFVVASAIGSPLSSVSYYDFRYPNATNMMIVAEHRYEKGTDRFEIRLPSEYGYYARGWHFGSVCRATSGTPKLYLDGEKLSEHGCSTSRTVVQESYGALEASQMLPDTDHRVSVYEPYVGDAYGALVLMYRVP